jgi:hypothetical protein
MEKPTDAQTDLIQARYPNAEMDEAVAWSDRTVTLEIQDEGWPWKADSAVEVEVGLRCLHVFFLDGEISGVSEV